jgi:hypothetical protein
VSSLRRTIVIQLFLRPRDEEEELLGQVSRTLLLHFLGPSKGTIDEPHASEACSWEEIFDKFIDKKSS